MGIKEAILGAGVLGVLTTVILDYFHIFKGPDDWKICLAMSIIAILIGVFWQRGNGNNTYNDLE